MVLLPVLPSKASTDLAQMLNDKATVVNLWYPQLSRAEFKAGRVLEICLTYCGAGLSNVKGVQVF